MAIATPESYNAMLDAAKAGSYAFPAINVTSSSTVTAAIQGFAAAESDGIIQVSIGGAQYASGSTIKDQVAWLGRARGLRPRGCGGLRRDDCVAY